MATAKKNATKAAEAKAKTSKKVMSKEEFVEKTLKAQEEKMTSKKATKTADTKKSDKKQGTKAKTTAKKSEAKKPVEDSLKKPSKTSKKSETAKKSDKKKKPEISERDKMFPAEFEMDDYSFKRVDGVKTYEDVKKLIDHIDDENGVCVAVNWPADMCVPQGKKKMSLYEANNYVPAPEDGFEYDLDILNVLFYQQAVERFLSVSIVTEAVGLFYKNYFKRTDEGWFEANEAPFEIYTMHGSASVEADDDEDEEE